MMMEPALSLLGYIVYGLLHVEPIGKAKDIIWFAPEGWDVNQIDYYAAQGNATRIFVQKYFSEKYDEVGRMLISIINQPEKFCK